MRHERRGARFAGAEQADREESEGRWHTGSQGHQAPFVGYVDRLLDKKVDKYIEGYR